MKIPIFRSVRTLLLLSVPLFAHGRPWKPIFLHHHRAPQAAHEKALNTIYAISSNSVVAIRLSNGRRVKGYIESISKGIIKLSPLDPWWNPWEGMGGWGGPDDITIPFSAVRTAQQEPVLVRLLRKFRDGFIVGAALPLTFLAAATT